MLGSYANEANECWPSVKRLSADCCCSERTVQRHLKSLEEKKLLGVSARKRENGSLSSNLYTLSICHHPPSDCHHPGDAGDTTPGDTVSPPEPVSKNKSEYSRSFLDFWEVYPRKVGKGRAFTKWKQHRKWMPDPGELKVIVEAHSKTRQWCEDGGKFIPHPATWIEQHRWDDEVSNGSKQLTDEERAEREAAARKRLDEFYESQKQS